MSRTTGRGHPSAGARPSATEDLPDLQRAASPAWRRNVTALWLSQFTSIFGFSFAIPFLPLFLSRDLGVTEAHQLAFWTGMAAALSGLGQAVVSPFWGALADRFGRKRMLVRAIIGGAAVLALTGVVQNVLQLMGARVLMGAAAGSIGSTNALVASETPRERVGWALGIVGSAVAIGRATGPLVGGLLAAFVDLRVVFLVGAIICLVPAPIVIAAVREGRPTLLQGERVRLPAALAAAGPGAAKAMAALVVAQGLVQFGYVGGQSFSVLRILQLEPGRAALATGIMFTCLGVSTALGALGSGWVGERIGYKRSSIVAAAAMAVGLAGLGAVPSVPLLLATAAGLGLGYGACGPLVSSMLGLEAPAAVKATVFGFGASSIALGSTIGPLAAGSLAAASSVSNALYLCAAAELTLMVLIAAASREPAAATVGGEQRG